MKTKEFYIKAIVELLEGASCSLLDLIWKVLKMSV